MNEKYTLLNTINRHQKTGIDRTEIISLLCKEPYLMRVDMVNALIDSLHTDNNLTQNIQTRRYYITGPAMIWLQENTPQKENADPNLYAKQALLVDSTTINTKQSLLIRADYAQIIEEARNFDKIALDDYIVKKLIPLKNENIGFVEILYKDIHYILKGIDEPGDNDLMIEDNDLVFEEGDFKLTGYQTRLHDLENWLHREIVEKMIAKNPFTLSEQMKEFEKGILNKKNYTIEYKTLLDNIRRSIRKERASNYGKPKSIVNRIGLFISNIVFFFKNIDYTQTNTIVTIVCTIIGIILTIVGLVKCN